MLSSVDCEYLKHALRLARRGFPVPNPHVGALVVRGGRVVGRGYHPYAGAPHAEQIALREAGALARNATLYVTLEPCCHYGRTPPCTQGVMEAGIKRVVVATEDPHPRVRGRGLQQLREAGLEVECLDPTNAQHLPLIQQAEQLNEIFFTFHRLGRPFITLKAAMSLDGKIATAMGDSKWITGERARRYAHRLRAEHGAVLVGIRTVLQDDPLLTARMRGVRHQPLRIVLDSRLHIPETARILDTTQAPTLLVCRSGDGAKMERLRARGIEIYQQSSSSSREDQIVLPDLIQYLSRKGIIGVLVEGGGQVIASFLSAGLVNKILFFYAPRIIGGQHAPTAVEGQGVQRVRESWQLERVRIRRLGTDWLVEGYYSSGHAQFSAKAAIWR